MYMYYLLGWRLHKNYYQMYKHRDVHLTIIEDKLKVSVITSPLKNCITVSLLRIS